MENPTRPMCRHCGRKPVSRPRGLCWPCYYTPGVKVIYPITSKFSKRGPGVGLDGGDDKQPDRPTPALQGTADKMREMAERAARGVSLFHRLDGAT